MTTNTAAILAKIGNQLLSAGVPREAAARLACTVMIDELTKNGMDMAVAYDFVFGNGEWQKLKAAC